MTYDPDRHNRRSIRLPDYDYRSPGAYFMTVCAANRQCLFGAVTNGQMIPNEYGIIVAEEWRRTELVRDRVVVDPFVVMPISTAGRFTERSEVNPRDDHHHRSPNRRPRYRFGPTTVVCIRR